MNRLLTAALAALGLTATFAPAPAQAQASDPFIGEVVLMPYTFCPRNWLPADGSLLQIASHSALFSLYGTTFGGDGRNTFGIPDLRGRVPIGIGRGPGLSDYRQGQMSGFEQVALTNPNQLPPHSHGAALNASTAASDGTSPDGAALAESGTNMYLEGGGALGVQLTAGTVTTSNTGASAGHENRMPYTAMRYCVSLEGVYPSRP